jgi:tetratricopeptide (TPR) repeat protein
MVQNPVHTRRTTCATHILICLLFLFVGLLLYSHTLEAPFYLDDLSNIRDGVYPIKSLSLREFFHSAFEGYAHRRPLANLTFSLNYYFHGFHLPGYHVVNIIIHVANGILLYLLVLKTVTLPGQRHPKDHPMYVAALAGLLWFVNPVQIQSVTYVVQRMTSMATLFVLSSFIFYVYARLSSKRPIRVAFFLCSACCWVLSVASKEIGVTLPIIVFVYEWFFFQNLDGAWLKRAAIFLVIGLTGFLIALSLIYNYSPLSLVTEVWQPRAFTPLERVLTQGRVIFLCMTLLLYPHPTRLNLNHDISVSHGLFDPVTTLLSFGGILVLLFVAALVARQHRLTAFSIIWFLGWLALEALAVDTELIFEHRVYLPSALFFLPIMRLVFRKLKKVGVVLPVTAAFIISFSFWTYQRNALWNDPVLFWKDAVTKSPNHYRAYFNLGTRYLLAEKYDLAVKTLGKALMLEPPYPTEIYTNLGAAYLAIHDHAQAKKQLNRALDLNPANYMALNHLGGLSAQEKNYQEALGHYQEAIKIQPGFAPSYLNLGMLFVDTGELNDAVKAFMRALDLRPRWSEAYSSLGLALAKQSQYDKAIFALQKATRIEAGNQEALFNLAKVYDLSGQHEMAVKAYETLIKMNPEDVEAMHNLGVIYLNRLKNVEQAKLYFSKALAKDPEYGHAVIARNILSQTALKP